MQITLVEIVIKVVEVAEVMLVVVVVPTEVVSLILLSQNTSRHMHIETMDFNFVPIPLWIIVVKKLALIT